MEEETSILVLEFSFPSVPPSVPKCPKGAEDKVKRMAANCSDGGAKSPPVGNFTVFPPPLGSVWIQLIDIIFFLLDGHAAMIEEGPSGSFSRDPSKSWMEDFNLRSRLNFCLSWETCIKCHNKAQMPQYFTTLVLLDAELQMKLSLLIFSPEY